MGSSRDIRRCALQCLYQFDAGMHDRPDAVLQSLAESPGDEAVHARGLEVASAAWDTHMEADQAVLALADDWPTYRQPVVDRSILRLAYYELVRTDTPPKVIINEAVELAKEFSTERSHLFINGVLDRLFRARRGDSALDPEPPDTEPPDTDPPVGSGFESPSSPPDPVNPEDD